MGTSGNIIHPYLLELLKALIIDQEMGDGTWRGGGSYKKLKVLESQIREGLREKYALTHIQESYLKPIFTFGKSMKASFRTVTLNDLVKCLKQNYHYENWSDFVEKEKHPLVRQIPPNSYYKLSDKHKKQIYNAISQRLDSVQNQVDIPQITISLDDGKELKYDKKKGPSIIYKDDELYQRSMLIDGLKKRYKDRQESKMQKEVLCTIDLELWYAKDENSGYYKYFYRSDFKEERPIPNFLALLQVYIDKIRHLMIIGNPGSGKTVLLINFAKILIQAAAKDDNMPIPVILDLASWHSDYQHFEQWIEDNLHYHLGEKGTSKEYAKQVLSNNNFRLLLLLDGLDEVEEDSRLSCLEKINRYFKNRESWHYYPQLILCSRTKEYQDLDGYAYSGAMVEIKKLSEKTVRAFVLKRAEKLKLATKLSHQLEDVAKHLYTAFDVHIALNLSQDVLYVFPKGCKNSEEFQQKMLVDYIEKELDKIIKKGSKDKTRDYLKFLAQQLDGKGISFDFVKMQPDWLKKPKKFKYFTGIIYGFLYALIIGLVYWLVSAEQTIGTKSLDVQPKSLNWLIGLLVYGPISGVVNGIWYANLGGHNIIEVEQIRVFDFNQFKLVRIGGWLKGGLVGGLFGGITGGLAGGLIHSIGIFGILIGGILGGSLSGIASAKASNNQVIPGITYGLTGGLVYGLAYGFLGATWAGIKGGILGGIIYGVAYGLLGGIIEAISVVQKYPVTKHPLQRFVGAIRFEVIRGTILLILFALLWFNIDFSPIIQSQSLPRVEIWKILLFIIVLETTSILFHTPLFENRLLTFMLYLEGSIPFSYGKFLNNLADKTGLLEKDGGQWKFRHQLIHDYFKGKLR